MRTSLILVRHGQTEWNVAGRIQGHGDSALTPLGILQAHAMAERLADERFDAIVSSDLGRARHTAQLLVPDRIANIRLHPGLRERAFGEAEGSTYAQIAGEHPEMFSRDKETDPHYAPAGGESRQQHLDRVRTTLTELAQDHQGSRVLVVTHGGVLSCVYRWLHGISAAAPHPIDIPNVGYNRIVEQEGAWSVDVWGDVAHLAGLGVTVAE
jgi:2,3-bisphosphoglycerate-dependent phosphoglycerate mutase